MLLREREAAIVLGVSISQVASYRRQGLLTAVRPTGIRAVRYSRAQVEQLAAKWCEDAGLSTEDAA